MLGAIAGDIIGSRFEKSGFKSTEFELFHRRCGFTDDTVLTIAVADALLHDKDFEENVKKYALSYPNRGYGGNFIRWMKGEMEGPYNSWGNGSAMRVSPIAFAFDTLEEVLAKAEAYYGPVPKEMEEKIRAILPSAFNQTIDLFYERYLS
jgi:ADP-ribosylglycohydrolase